jgi:hypothetical protein
LTLFSDIYFAQQYHGGTEWNEVENAVHNEHAQHDKVSLAQVESVAHEEA